MFTYSSNEEKGGRHDKASNQKGKLLSWEQQLEEDLQQQQY